MTENVLIVRTKGGEPKAVVINNGGKQIFYGVNEMGQKDIQDLLSDTQETQ